MNYLEEYQRLFEVVQELLAEIESVRLNDESRLILETANLELHHLLNRDIPIERCSPLKQAERLEYLREIYNTAKALGKIGSS